MILINGLVFIFLYYVPLIQCYSMQCESPLKHAQPLSKAKLISFALFLRHGLRAPINSHEYLSRSEVGTWICDSDNSEAPRNHFSTFISNNHTKMSRRYFNQLDTNLVEYPPNCQAGDLLVEGMRQHYELGQFYQQYLIHELHFLPRIINPELMELRSSHVERTFRSGESFMAGFYPPVSPNELITFITGSDTLDYLTPDPAMCSDLNKSYKIFERSEELRHRISHNRVLYSKIYEALNITFDNSNWNILGDILALPYCTSQKVPKSIENLITDEIFEQSQQDSAFYFYGIYNIKRGVSSAPLFRDLFKKFDNSTSKKRFFLFSAHDTTLMSILSTFGYTDNRMPTFRSHLAFEIWEKPEGSGKRYVRVVMNGEEVDIGDGTVKITIMEYQKFKEKLAQLGINSYCHEYMF